MNELQIFNNPEFGNIRTIERDGEPWFVGKDVAAALGYEKPQNAISAHVDNKDKTTALIQGTGSTIRAMQVLINRIWPLQPSAVQQAAHSPEVQALGNQRGDS